MKVRILTKKDLYYLLGLTSKRGNYNVIGFYDIFNEDLVSQVLGLSIEQFKKIRTFNFSQSQKLINHFQITQDELAGRRA